MVADWFDKPRQSPVTAPSAVTTDTRVPPCVGHAAYSPDYESERPGDYLEDRQPTSASRYPEPTAADLVTLWKKDRRVVMSVTAGGRVQDFYMPPGRLAYLIKEVAEQLAESTIIQQEAHMSALAPCLRPMSQRLAALIERARSGAWPGRTCYFERLNNDRLD